MRLVFMGTSSFAVPSLSKIIQSKHQIVGVVTQPDRPRGRGKKILFSPVKQVALENDLPIYQPRRIREGEAIDRVRSWEPDLVVVVSYGQIIPPEILDYPRFNCINLHASLLPKYRGPAPIQRAIMAGETKSGVTVMFMDETLDTGDIIMQVPLRLDEEMDRGQIEAAMARIGADLLIDTIAVLASGSCPRRKQENPKFTYAAMLTDADERIDWKAGAVTIRNQIRALSPIPGAYTYMAGTRLKFFKSRIYEARPSGRKPGEVAGITEEGFLVQTGQGILEILEVQKEGKNRIPCSQFLRGFSLNPGEIFG